MYKLDKMYKNFSDFKICTNILIKIDCRFV